MEWQYDVSWWQAFTSWFSLTCPGDTILSGTGHGSAFPSLRGLYPFLLAVLVVLVLLSDRQNAIAFNSIRPGSNKHGVIAGNPCSSFPISVAHHTTYQMKNCGDDGASNLLEG